MQAYLNVKIKKREGRGLLQRWFHVALSFGGVVSFTAAMLLFQSHGGIIAAVSTSLNDVLAWLFSITLAFTAIVELQISYHTVTLTEFPKWPRWILYSGNVVTILLWLQAVIFMSVAQEKTVYKFPAYFSNCLCLFALTIIITVASWKLISMNSHIDKEFNDSEKLSPAKQLEREESAKRMWTFKIFTGSVIVVALFVMSWNLYSASRLLNSNSYYAKSQRTYSSVATSVATRFIGFLVMLYFTYRMWLWDGVPCCPSKQPQQRMNIAGTTQRTHTHSKKPTVVSGRPTMRESKSYSTRHAPEPSDRRSSQTTTIPPLNTSHLPSSVTSTPDRDHKEDILSSDVELKSSQQHEQQEQQQHNNNNEDYVIPSPSRMHTQSMQFGTTPAATDPSFLNSNSNRMDRQSYIITNDSSFPLSSTNSTVIGGKTDNNNDHNIDQIGGPIENERQLSASMLDSEESGVVLRSSVASDSHLDS